MSGKRCRRALWFRSAQQRCAWCSNQIPKHASAVQDISSESLLYPDRPLAGVYAFRGGVYSQTDAHLSWCHRLRRRVDVLQSALDTARSVTCMNMDAELLRVRVCAVPCSGAFVGAVFATGPRSYIRLEPHTVRYLEVQFDR